MRITGPIFHLRWNSIVEGDERLVIGLSKMIKKNSGGEGQNPLYIALLASFAQAYHINLSAED